MKKETLKDLYILYSNTDKEKMLLVINNYLDLLKDLGGIEEKILLKLFKHNFDVIDEDNIDRFISLSSCLSRINDNFERNFLIDNINELFEKDFINSSVSFNNIIQGIMNLLYSDFEMYFDVLDSSDFDYYKVDIINEYIELLSNIGKNNIEDIYNHDLDDIINSFIYVVNDMYNSYSIDQKLSENEIYLKRIKYFKNLVTNKKIYALEDGKYNIVLKIAKVTRRIEDLKKLEIKSQLGSYLLTDQYGEYLDHLSENVSEFTVERLYKELGLFKGYKADDEYESIERDFELDESISIKKEKDAIKKVLKIDLDT